jgi:hypothetical protein
MSKSSKDKPNKDSFSFEFDDTYKLGTNDNTVTLIPKGDPYLDNLPKDLDPKTVKKVGDYNRRFITAFEKAAAEELAKKMAENESLDYGSAVVKNFGADKVSKVEVELWRAKEQVLPKDGTKVVRPYLKTKVTWRGAKGSKTEHAETLKHIRSILGSD